MITIRKIWIILFVSIFWNFFFYTIGCVWQGVDASIVVKGEIDTFKHPPKVYELPSEVPNSQILVEVVEEIQEEEYKSFITPSKPTLPYYLKNLAFSNISWKYLNISQDKRYILFCCLRIPC